MLSQHFLHAQGVMADGETRPAFGNRYLEDPSKVYEHNAWDSVQWDSEQERVAEEKVKLNSSIHLPEEDTERYELEAAQHWDDFYQQHQNRFFKDRHWLFTEFPELKGNHTSPGQDANEQGSEDSRGSNEQGPGDTKGTDLALKERFNIFEVGCGAGNTVFPILQTNSDPRLFVYCCDFAESAVQIVKEHSLYDPSRCLAFQCNIATPTMPLPFPANSIDLIILIFVLSAIEPQQFQTVVRLLSDHLRPGGMILFRDYGRYDMAQLRFKKGQCLSDNFYVRGDGTRVYFFTEGEVDQLFSQAGLVKEQLYVDRRLQVNRGRQLKMYRVWIQAKYRKPLSNSAVS